MTNPTLQVKRKTTASGGAPASLAVGEVALDCVNGILYGGLNGPTVAALSSSNPMTTLGDLVYGGASGAYARLAGDTSNARKFLREQSSGGTATAPVWDTLQDGDIPATLARLASPALTGTPTAPTATAATGGTQIASCGYVDALLKSLTPGGRLTNVAATPEGVYGTASSYLYYVPYIHNQITVDNGSGVLVSLTIPGAGSGFSLLATGKCYDVFAYSNSGTLALYTVAWTSYTARATAIVNHSTFGFLVLSGYSPGYRYLGTYYCPTTNTVNLDNSYAGSGTGSGADVHQSFWNYYNRVSRNILTEYAGSYGAVTAAAWASMGLGTLYTCNGWVDQYAQFTQGVYYAYTNGGGVGYELYLATYHGGSVIYAGFERVSTPGAANYRLNLSGSYADQLSLGRNVTTLYGGTGGSGSAYYNYPLVQVRYWG